MELLTVYKKLKMLNVVRMKLIERVEDTENRDYLQEESTPKLAGSLITPTQKRETDHTDPIQRGNEIKKRFQGLKDVQKRFNDKVLGIVSKAYYHAKDEPKLLVCAMRITMNEERACS